MFIGHRRRSLHVAGRPNNRIPIARCLALRFCGRQNIHRDDTLMTRIGLSLGIALVALVPLSAMAEDQHAVVQADGFKWAAGPQSLPKGAQIALLFGDPAKEGAYGYRVKVPAGYTVPAHTHPTDENITVIYGTFIIGVGDKLEPNKGEAVKAGGYFHMPKGMHHYMSFPEATVFQANGYGPAGITYLNPADDPRKTN